MEKTKAGKINPHQTYCDAVRTVTTKKTGRLGSHNLSQTKSANPTFRHQKNTEGSNTKKNIWDMFTQAEPELSRLNQNKILEILKPMNRLPFWQNSKSQASVTTQYLVGDSTETPTQAPDSEQLIRKKFNEMIQAYKPSDPILSISPAQLKRYHNAFVDTVNKGHAKELHIVLRRYSAYYIALEIMNICNTKFDVLEIKDENDMKAVQEYMQPVSYVENLHRKQRKKIADPDSRYYNTIATLHVNGDMIPIDNRDRTKEIPESFEGIFEKIVEPYLKEERLPYLFELLQLKYIITALDFINKTEFHDQRVALIDCARKIINKNNWDETKRQFIHDVSFQFPLKMQTIELILSAIKNSEGIKNEIKNRANRQLRYQEVVFSFSRKPLISGIQIFFPMIKDEINSIFGKIGLEPRLIALCRTTREEKSSNTENLFFSTKNIRFGLLSGNIKTSTNLTLRDIPGIFYNPSSFDIDQYNKRKIEYMDIIKFDLREQLAKEEPLIPASTDLPAPSCSTTGIIPMTSPTFDPGSDKWDGEDDIEQSKPDEQEDIPDFWEELTI